MTITSEENARSKELLLAAMDRLIMDAMEEPIGLEKLVAPLIMNRNRVARFLDLPTRNFKERRSNEVIPTHNPLEM